MTPRPFVGPGARRRTFAPTAANRIISTHHFEAAMRDSNVLVDADMRA